MANNPQASAAPGLYRRARSPRWWSSALVVIVLVAGACSGDDRADDPLPTTIETADTTGTTASSDDAERQAVIDAYEASTEARIEASAPPEPHPEAESIVRTHTGPMLERSQEVLRGLAANGWAIRYPEDSQRRVEVESVELTSEDVAILTLCAVDDGERVVVATGEVLASGVGTVEAEAAMQRVDGRWLLAEREETNRWEGVAGCAEGW